MARGVSALTGPASSIGSPMTLMMRPSVPTPTGTVIGRPVSVTAWPRTRPSVVSMAMVRTVESRPDAAPLRAPGGCRRSGFERIQDLGQVAVELHVDDGADDLGNTSNLIGWAISISPSNVNQRRST